MSPSDQITLSPQKQIGIIKSTTGTTSTSRIFRRILRNSAPAPTIAIHPLFRKAYMGSLVHPRECGKATAVFATFHPDLVAEISKCGSRRLILHLLVQQWRRSYLFYCCRRRNRSSYLTVETRATLLCFLSRCTR